ILQSLCDEIADTAWVTAHFVPACSDVMLSQPANNFIANTETGDILSITLQNFDVNFPNFGYIRLEQRIAGSPSWTTLRTFYPTNLFNSPTNTDGTKEDIGDRAAIVYDWNMASRADGQYELRATTASVNISNNEIVDSPLSTYSTEAITGYKDMVKPQALGAPSPANGIYGASDELSITFNEEINTAMVISDNIAVTYGASATPVPVTFVASANKITLEYPSDYFSILEDQTLDITVSDIYDMHGNKSEPISWQAYVNRNALVWETDEINLVKEAGATLTFTAKIKNAGANTVSYSFVNLPQWLSVNQPTGNLQPLAVKELTFSISSGVNLGAYNEQIGLTSGNGIVKKLPLNLAVTGALPEGWTVNPADYERTMTVTGRLQIGGIYQTDEADMLAAFIGDECLGITSPIKPQAAIDGYYTFLTVYGNSAHEGQPVKFKLWDASTGNIYSAIESTLSGVAQNITFAADAMKGSVSVPLIHNAQDIVEQSIVLNNGWSWISVNVLNSNPNIFSQFVERIGENGVQLKSKNGYAEAPDWIGTLSSIEKEQMYLVQTDAATTLKFDGTPAAPASSPITLANGWNWLGYIPQFTLPVNEALSNLTAQANDQIKGQKAYRSFANAEIGWVGTLNYLRTGEGYMYYSGAGGSTSFNYPGAGSQIYRAASRASEAAADNHWTVNVHAYPNSMTMTSVMIKNGVELQSDQMEIAAFDANSECRGSIRLNNYPQEAAHPYLAFLMIYGEESVPLTFKAYDHATETEYAVTNTENFVINNRYGNSREPYEFILYAPTGIDESGIEQIAVYPNPATEILNIAYPFNSIEKLEITDLSGRIIRSERNFSANKINVTSLVEGLYLLKVTHDGETVVKKFAVKY
ncbi:MAG: T9SS type A sorting domain-containing protein, partial [Prevotella sp.]|nr:T9SS type A sorting domain-containing protein [Prevotella sp.]